MSVRIAINTCTCTQVPACKWKNRNFVDISDVYRPYEQYRFQKTLVIGET